MLPSQSIKSIKLPPKIEKHISPIEVFIKPDTNKIIKKKVIIKDKPNEIRIFPKILKNYDTKVKILILNLR